MESCPECETKMNIITLKAVDTVIHEVGFLGIAEYVHIKGRHVRCIKCKKDFLIITHKKMLVPIDETPKD